MLAKVKHMFAKDPVISISGLLAAATAFVIPPSREYLSYIDIRTLALLFALMAVVSALARKGLLDAAAGFFIRRASGMRSLGRMLTLLCYASSMLITNDVALIAFVPLTLILMRGETRAMLTTVVLQTVAANLGSMLTPFGNPQNLYLYSAYQMNGADFFSAVLPVGGVSLIAVLLLCFLLPDRPVTVHTGAQKGPLHAGGSLLVLAALFLLCVLAVLRFMPYAFAVAAVTLVLLFMDRQALCKVDYHLLVTFCFFFVFVGNLGRMEAVENLLGGLLYGREVLVSAMASQFVSNVPAALMLSEFTDKGKALVTGTNIGGLGTLIASMASLISFKLYAKAEGAQPGRYLKLFSLINFGLLAVLLALALTVFARL